MYLLLGDIYPEYDERRIGISNQLAIKAISKSTGTEEKEVISKWKSIGDLGKVARELKKHKKQSTLHSQELTTEKVLSNFRELPNLEGKGTVNKKLSLIVEVLTSASPLESLYIIRTLIGDLRIGIKESTIRESMANAFFPKNKKEVSKKIQDAIDKSNDVGIVFEIVKKKDLKNLGKIKLEIGKPIKAMLCQKTKSIAEGFKALGKPCAIEYKYDGFRMIIHKKDDKVIIFT
jgi:DNA ligase-1